MIQPDYEKAKRECWEELCKEYPHPNSDMGFRFAFDRAYDLGKQTEAITQEEIEKEAKDYAYDVGDSDWERLRVQDAFVDGANFALGKQEKDVKQSSLLEEEIHTYAKMCSFTEEDYTTIRKAVEFGVSLGKQEMDADTVIQGWVARDDNGPHDLGLRIYTIKPKRQDGLKRWNGHGEISYLIDHRLFPDLTWESDPQECEIVIKRKKK